DALYLAITMMDLTTLEGADTPGKVRQMARKARTPVPPSLLREIVGGKDVPEIPSTAAVCVYPKMVPYAVDALRGSGVEVAAVATAFPSGQFPLDLKLRDVKRTLDLGATEIDI